MCEGVSSRNEWWLSTHNIFNLSVDEAEIIMKRLLFAGLAVTFVSVMFVPQAMADNPFSQGNSQNAEKVDVCHVIAANDVISFGNEEHWVDLYFGKEISVSENAGDAHEAHGDSTSFWGDDDAAGPINKFREAGAHLPAANCFFGIKQD